MYNFNKGINTTPMLVKDHYTSDCFNDGTDYLLGWTGACLVRSYCKASLKDSRSCLDMFDLAPVIKTWFLLSTANTVGRVIRYRHNFEVFSYPKNLKRYRITLPSIGRNLTIKTKLNKKFNQIKINGSDEVRGGGACLVGSYYKASLQDLRSCLDMFDLVPVIKI